jgi:hypothetical protein
VTRALLAIALLAVSCAPFGTSTPSSDQRYAMYQYAIEVPTKPVTPNQRLSLTWEPRQAATTSPSFSDVQLCVALFGPFESVEALKRAAQPEAPSCPPTGATATSQTLRTTTHSGARMATDVMVPSAPGFYDLRQISILGVGNSTSAGSVIEVR